MFPVILKTNGDSFHKQKKFHFILINIYNQKHFRLLSVNNLFLLVNVPEDLGCP